MNIKRRHVSKTWKVVKKTTKKVPWSVIAPVAIDVATELIPGTKLTKVAVIVGKAALNK